jgi:hypothetical protein
LNEYEDVHFSLHRRIHGYGRQRDNALSLPYLGSYGLPEDGPDSIDARQ